jgi:hypothetical protein
MINAFSDISAINQVFPKVLVGFSDRACDVIGFTEEITMLKPEQLYSYCFEAFSGAYSSELEEEDLVFLTQQFLADRLNFINWRFLENDQALAIYQAKTDDRIRSAEETTTKKAKVKYFPHDNSFSIERIEILAA